MTTRAEAKLPWQVATERRLAAEAALDQATAAVSALQERRSATVDAVLAGQSDRAAILELDRQIEQAEADVRVADTLVKRAQEVEQVAQREHHAAELHAAAERTTVEARELAGLDAACNAEANRLVTELDGVLRRWAECADGVRRVLAAADKFRDAGAGVILPEGFSADLGPRPGALKALTNRPKESALWRIGL